MIKINIVDDELTYFKRVKDDINQALFNYDFQYKINHFTKYDDALIKEINNCDELKIYIMDVELKDSLSGIQIAQKIRDIDWESIIIFLTSHDKMFESVYREVYEVFDFIEKFHDMDNHLIKDLKIITNHNFDCKMFKYHSRSNDIQIYYKNINYIKRDSTTRKLLIKTLTSSYYINMNLNEILPKLDKRFAQISRSCIVNRDNIVDLDWPKGFFVVKGGEIIYEASKLYKNEFES